MSERRLGRGLEALLGPMSRQQAEASGALRELAVGAVRSNPFQPRRAFDPQALQELADSIAASGLLQPIVVRPVGEGAFELIAGERRWRAVQRLGWPKIPAVVKEADDRALLTLALIENLQRDQLTPLDTARGYERLVREFALGQAEVARLVGKDRTTVTNTLRLLKLPAEVQALIDAGRLSEGHGRALLPLGDDRQVVKMAKNAVAADWTVRTLEAKVRGTAPARPGRRAKPAAGPASEEARRVEDALQKRLATDVKITAKRRGRGLVTISYYSNDDLARVLELILGEPFA